MDPVSAFMRLSGETDIKKKKTNYVIASYLPCGQCDRRGRQSLSLFEAELPRLFEAPTHAEIE